MGLMDKLKGTADSVRKQHGDKLAAGVDAAGGAVNKATKGKYADKVDKGVGLAKKPLAKPGAEEPVPGDVTAPPPPPPPAPPGTGEDTGTTGESSPGTPGGSMPGTTPPTTAP